MKNQKNASVSIIKKSIEVMLATFFIFVLNSHQDESPRNWKIWYSSSRCYFIGQFH